MLKAQGSDATLPEGKSLKKKLPMPRKALRMANGSQGKVNSSPIPVACL